MKQAIIYARDIERGALKEQLAVCRLYAACCGYRIVRIICQRSTEPSVRRLSRCNPSFGISFSSMPLTALAEIPSRSL